MDGITTALIPTLKGLIFTAPYAATILVLGVIFLTKSLPGIVEAWRNKAPEIKSCGYKKVCDEDFVKVKNCHAHIDRMSDDLNNQIGFVSESLKKIEQTQREVFVKIDDVTKMLFSHVNK